MKIKEEFEITLDDLKEGITLCFRKSHAFTTTARILFRDSNDTDVVSALLINAIEELGKGLFLKEYYEDNNISIPKWIFGIKGKHTHTKKIQRGMDELGEQSLIHPKHFEILSHKDTKFKSDGSFTYTGTPPSPDELHEMTQAGFGGNLDSMVEYKTRVDQNKKFQLFYVDWNDEEKKWQYGMFQNDWQINNLLTKLESFLQKYHNTNSKYSFEYS